jgi:hypothetical protein
MKPKLYLPKSATAGASGVHPEPGIGNPANPEPGIKDVNARKTEQFMASQSIFEVIADKLISEASAKAVTARKRFFAMHGSDAVRPRRPASPKEIRKILVNSEMALWERF